MSKKHLFLILKIFIAVLVFGLVGWELVKAWDKIKEVNWSPNYSLLILSGICYAIAYLPAAFYWRFAIKSMGQNPGWYETFRAYYIGHLGKYVPGKGMVLVIRTGLLDRHNTRYRIAGACIFLETMTMMAVGAFVAAVIMLVWFRNIDRSEMLTYLSLATLAGTLLPILPPIFRYAAKKCSIDLTGLTFRTLAVGWLLNIPLWFMLGLSLWLTMLGFGMESKSALSEIPFCMLAISFSIVFGFISMLPGGLGTREWAMLIILTPFFTTHPVGDIAPVAMASVILIVQRIISILSELAVAALLAYKPKKGNSHKETLISKPHSVE